MFLCGLAHCCNELAGTLDGMLDSARIPLGWSTLSAYCFGGLPFRRSTALPVSGLPLRRLPLHQSQFTGPSSYHKYLVIECQEPETMETENVETEPWNLDRRTGTGEVVHRGSGSGTAPGSSGTGRVQEMRGFRSPNVGPNPLSAGPAFVFSRD